MSYTYFSLEDQSFETIQILLGDQDKNIDRMIKSCKTDILYRDQSLKIEETEQTPIVLSIIEKCLDMISVHHSLNEQDVSYVVNLAKRGLLDRFDVKHIHPIHKTKNGKLIYPKTLGQAILFDALQHNDIIFTTGVAGTGKTYVSVAYAVHLLINEQIDKIILTRPAVEAGESLGFLPGDMKDKVDPYLRPLYDALDDMLGKETVENFIEKGIIEVAPLAFMRGRTLNHALVILDEAQNTTQSQMKMFLTRMGDHAKMIINGDVTQIDLIKKQDSGLMQACELLQGIPRISMIHLDASDVVRHPLVQKIIERYAKIEK